VSGVVVVETIRRHVTSVGYIALLIISCLLAMLTAMLAGPPEVWRALIAVSLFVFGAQLIGPEFSKGTLQLILSKPVSRSAYLLSRYAGVLLSFWLLVAVPFACDSAVRLFAGAEVDWSHHAATSVNLCIDAVLTCALLALLGSMTRAYFNIAIYAGLNAALSMLTTMLRTIAGGAGLGSLSRIGDFLRAHPAVITACEAVDRNLFPTPPPDVDGKWVLLMVTNAAVALLIACLIFREREVPYGAD
jgi:ABC-type transport system involved in multi-copper enzyme maturation permease subunit